MTIDRETIETLHDEPELLAIADAVQKAGPQFGSVRAPRRRRRPIRLVAVALVAAATVGLVLASPWDSGGGPSLVDKAIAAVGNRPVLHVVVRYTVGERIDLRTGRSSPEHRDLELWYDAKRQVFRTEALLDGRVVYRSAGKGNLGNEPFLLTSLYRKALKDGKLRKLRETVIRGRRAVVVQARLPHGGLARYYLDAHTFRLLRMQYFLNGRFGSQMDVLKFETVSRAEARLPKHPTQSPSSSSGSETSGSGSAVVGEAALKRARTVFGRPAFWPGRSVDGHRLTESQLESDTATTDGSTVRGRKLVLDYGPESKDFGQAYLEIEELPSNSPLLKVEGIDQAPRAGYLDLTPGETSSQGNQERTQWTGAMRKNGFTIQLTSWSRTTLIAAARAMRPVP